ncbi:MAG: hypothetical protein NTU63_03240 [Candidatus Pacearchaeota archaeon]|nr:hypothetical protein [Candidatus Pacearchaeota archaeon]
MCKQCEKNPVYEFTNKRKLCKGCFIEYFHKKIFYTIRRFDMIKKGEIVGYRNNEHLSDVVLKEILLLLSGKIDFKLIELPSKKINKTANNSCLDLNSILIVGSLINKKTSYLKKFLPVQGKTIKPLYLFLKEEILLYAQIKNLKFKKEEEKKNKIGFFIDELEKKHPEIKRATVNSILELYKE